MQQFGAPAPFVGLDNYVALVTDPYLWTVVVRSIVFCVVTAVVTVAIGGAMAVLMNALATWPRIVLQVALLVAWAMPVVAAMTVWIWIVDWRRGLLNWALVQARRRRRAGPQLARRAAVLLRRRLGDHRLDERAVRRAVDLRRASPR